MKYSTYLAIHTQLQDFQVDFAVDKRRKGAGPFVLSPKICISLLLRYIALWEMTTVSLSLQMNEVKQGGKSELNWIKSWGKPLISTNFSCTSIYTTLHLLIVYAINLGQTNYMYSLIAIWLGNHFNWWWKLSSWLSLSISQAKESFFGLPYSLGK